MLYYFSQVKKFLSAKMHMFVLYLKLLIGMTVGSMVKLLNVPRANKRELTMNERIHTRVCHLNFVFIYNYYLVNTVDGPSDGWTRRHLWNDDWKLQT